MPIVCPEPLSAIPADAIPVVQDGWHYAPLPHPHALRDHDWPEGTRPLVTVNCMTYNHASFIRQALDGFLMQETTFPVQIVIHDDASTDSTADIVREYATRYPALITAVLQPKNLYRRGLKAQLRPLWLGKYVASCEGDDYWVVTDKLERQAHHLESHPDCIAVGARSFLQREGDPSPYAIEPAITPESLAKAPGESFFVRHWIHTATMMRRVSLIDQFRAEVADVRLHYDLGINLYTLLQVLRHGKSMAVFNDVTSVYRKHPGGIYSGVSLEQQAIREYHTRRYFSRCFPPGATRRTMLAYGAACCRRSAFNKSLPRKERAVWALRTIQLERIPSLATIAAIVRLFAGA